MAGELVSIIIPLYNVEKYISQCIESVLRQKYSKFEVIIVNDGSTDSSASIVEKYAETDSRIRLINQDNAGVSAARNTGLDNASGEYVVFIDADDFISQDFLEYMVGLCKRNDVDFSLSENAFTQKGEKQVEVDNERLINSEQAVALLLSPRVIVGCWNKIFRRSFLVNNRLRFSTSLFYGEGLNFITLAADRAKAICVGQRKVYYYRRNNETSATTSFDIKKMRNGDAALDRIQSEIQCKSRAIDDVFCLHKGLFALGAMTRIINNRVKRVYKDEYLRWKRMLRDNTFRITFSKNISMYRRFMLWGGVLCPSLMARLDVIRRRKISDNSFSA